MHTSLHPDKNTKSALVTAIYKQPGLHSRAVIDLFKVSGCKPILETIWLNSDTQGPSFTADSVVGRDGFLVGAEATYDVTSGTVTRYATALGFSAPEYAVTLHGLGNWSTYSASYYHRVSRDVEAGAKAIYDGKHSQGTVSLEVGAKAYVTIYQLP